LEQMTNTKKQDNKSHVVAYLDMITRKRYLFLAIFVLITTISIFYSYMAPKIYSASATILVEKDKVINPLIRGLAVAQTSDERLTTIRQLILSRSRLIQVVKKLDLDLNIKNPLEYEMFIEGMRKSTQIEVTGKNLYRISYEGSKPEAVQNIVNTICNLFIEENLGVTRGYSQDAFSFISTQLETYRKKLEASESSLRAFKEENLGQLPGEENNNLNKSEGYQKLLTDAERELQEARLQKSLLEKQIAGEQPLVMVFSSRMSNSLEDQLTQLKLKLSSLMNKYTEKYPDVISTKAQIEKIEQQLAEEAKNKKTNKSKNERKEEDNSAKSTTEALNPIYQQMKEDLGNINIKINVLESRVQEYTQKSKEYEERVKGVPKLEQKLIQLKRGYDVDAGIYKTLLGKLEEARISRELESRENGSNFQIIDLAQLPLVPSKPNRPGQILFGMALGLLASFALMYLLYYLDNSIKSAEDARESFNYPLLANIPLMVCEEDMKKKRISNFLFFSTSSVFVVSVFALMIKELIARYPLFLK
jgi:polysaccharide chain length determinant protein (PEP-CTERM system associated)